jgi:hypothetical protein
VKAKKLEKIQIGGNLIEILFLLEKHGPSGNQG